MPAIWQSADTVPRDGSWFILLRPGVLVGRGYHNAIPDLHIIHRARQSLTSDGVWMTSFDHSMADSFVSSPAMWAPLDALPLAEMYRSIELKSRTYSVYTPRLLPVPFEKVEL